MTTLELWRYRLDLARNYMIYGIMTAEDYEALVASIPLWVRVVLWWESL